MSNPHIPVLITPFERTALAGVWNAICVFIALWYLTGESARSALVAIFVLLSSAFGYGGRWLIRGGFLLSVLAVAVFLGFPAPAQWADIAEKCGNAGIAQMTSGAK